MYLKVEAEERFGGGDDLRHSVELYKQQVLNSGSFPSTRAPDNRS